MSITEQVARVLESQSEARQHIFSPEALEALKLAEQFADIEPEQYVLPLDAMAGFPVQSRTGRK